MLGLPTLHPDFKGSKICSEPKGPLVGGKTSIHPRVVLNGGIVFSARIMGVMNTSRFPKSLRHDPWSLSLVYRKILW